LPERRSARAAAVPDPTVELDPAQLDEGDLDDEGPRRRVLPYVIAAAVMLVVMIVAIVAISRGRDEPSAAVAGAARVAADAGTVPPAIATAATDAAEPGEPGEPGDAGASSVDAAALASSEIEMLPPEEAPAAGSAAAAAASVTGSAAPEPAVKKPRPRPSRTAQQLYTAGLAAWNKRDLDRAYELFTDGRHANARYAPNWYGIALVHEKRGRKAAAKVAYQRYLALDPNAANAKALREHLKKL
ncbi:MAG: tetratricopeptide repeat protein, partial [Myxococcota bacterium]|nr:tetratricopeptide repeat protein [Myxococcota bacterium]